MDGVGNPLDGVSLHEELMYRHCPRVVAFPGSEVARCRSLLYRMAHLPRELWCMVDTHIVSGTTFSEFVAYTKHWTVEQRAATLGVWIQAQPMDEGLGSFEGTSDEVKLVTDHVDGRASPACSCTRVR